MKKIVIFCAVIFCFFFTIQSFAQTEEEYKKMLEEMKKQSQEQNDAFGKLLENAQNQNNSNSKQVSPSILNDNGSIDFSLPLKKTEILNNLPKTSPSKEKIIGYLKKLLAELENNKLYSKDVAFAKQQIDFIKNPATYNNAPLLFWYKKSPVTAIALSLMLAEKSNYNTLHLNNLAALLNLMGNPERAVPLLLYINKEEPNSSMVNNNLGQAYFLLGDVDLATRYLNNAVKKEKFHIQANLTLGIICAKTNKNKEAETYLLNSMRGGYTEDAFNLLAELLPDNNIEEMVFEDNQVFLANNMSAFNYSDYSYYATNEYRGGSSFSENKPDFFMNLSWFADYPNAFKSIDNRYTKYPIGVGDIVRFNSELKGKQDAYRDWMEIWSSDFEKQMLNSVTQLMNNKQPEMKGPGMGKAAFMIKVYGKKFDKRLKELSISYSDKMSQASLEYTRTMQEVEEGCRGLIGDEHAACYCPPNGEAISVFLQTMRAPYNMYCDNVTGLSMKYYNAMSYWASIAYDSNPIIKNTILQQAQAGYLAAMGSRFNLEPPEPCKAVKFPVEEKLNLAFSEPKCPIDITIPFYVGKLSLNCNNFSISGGEGLILGYERNFTSKTTTVLLGPGVDIQGGVVEFEAAAQGFVTWNNNDSISDFGVRVSAEAGAGNVGPFTAGSIEGQMQMGIESGFSASAGVNAFSQSVASYQL